MLKRKLSVRLKIIRKDIDLLKKRNDVLREKVMTFMNL